MDPLLPVETNLYGLQPYRMNTGFQESLVSYIERLADAHNITPECLMRDYISEKLITIKKFDKILYHPAVLDFTANYSSADIVNRKLILDSYYTINLASILSIATGVSELINCTLINLNKVFSTANRKKWFYYCPECIYEGNLNNNCYNQLIWELDCVTACPIHNIKLVIHECLAPAHKRLKSANRKYYPGCCSICGSINYKCTSVQKKNASSEEICIAKKVVSYLDGTHINEYNLDRTYKYIPTVVAFKRHKYYLTFDNLSETGLALISSLLNKDNNWFDFYNKLKIPPYIQLHNNILSQIDEKKYIFEYNDKLFSRV
jgi:hypothetical protein